MPKNLRRGSSEFQTCQSKRAFSRTQAFEALETLEEHLNKLELAMDVQNLLGPRLGSGWVSSSRALSLTLVGREHRGVDLCKLGLLLLDGGNN